jgi:hypothetical protein
LGAWSAPASAFGPVGTDPSGNFSVRLPYVCYSDPSGADCMADALQYLNQARASLGQGPYRLPGDFVSLTSEQQALVLTNLDRIQYGLPPVPGLTAALDHDALGGVQADTDPSTSLPADTANWAGGYPNLPWAYGGWMYDDGPGSGNIDCTPSDSSGCWGHRHDVLWDFSGGPGGALAMGAATGTDSSGIPGYAMLIAQGDPSYQPVYTYTWDQALAAGAGTSGATGGSGGGSGSGGGGSGGSGAGGAGTTPATLKLSSLRVTGHRVSFKVTVSPGAVLSCALTRQEPHGYARDHFRSCKLSTSFSSLRRGRYRLRIRVAGGSTITKYVRIL